MCFLFHNKKTIMCFLYFDKNIAFFLIKILYNPQREKISHNSVSLLNNLNKREQLKLQFINRICIYIDSKIFLSPNYV